jgi:glycosyltransferase involved in cell wall biosynthesis
MNKIKVLFHTQPNITSFNAQDLNGREIASRLDENLFKIYFIDTLHTDIDPKIKKDNIKIFKVSKNKVIRKIQIFKYKLLRKYDFSFYIRVFKSESYFLKLLPYFDKKRVTIHMIENKLPYPADEEYNKTAKFNALHSDYLFPISKEVEKDMQNLYGIKNNKIIHVGVDTTLFKSNFSKNNKRLKILSCGTFQKRKQPLLFAEIAKAFPECDFYWIGEGELKKEVLEKRKKNNIINFNLLNNMRHSELSKFMANSDIFLFPSIHEGFGKVIVEAMASGLPVIAFNNYNPEAIINGVTGFIVSDEKEMIKKLKLLIENKELREKMGKEAVKRAKEFDWKTIVKQWEEIMKEISNANATQ